MRGVRRAACHPDRAEASRGMCQPCYKRWLKETPKGSRAPVARTWRRPPRADSTCHPGKPAQGLGLCFSCYQKHYRSRNEEVLKGKARERHLRSKYGISEEARAALEEAQGGVCAVCQKPSYSGRRLHVDHDHKTGKVRGLLCATCNWFLGKVDRDPEIASRLITYRGSHAPE